jgi:maltose O-acetyltransferase
MTTVHPIRAELGPDMADLDAGGASVGRSGPAKALAIRVLGYLTNHLVAHLPSFRLRHAWYRRVLGLSLAPGCGIHMGCFVWFNGPGQIRLVGSSIGTRTRINRDCCLDVRGPLSIGHDVSVSPEVMILTGQHRHDRADFAFETRPVVIDDYVWIGSRALILPGATIGRGAVVAAGAVVSGRVPPMTVVGGVPARPIGVRPERSVGYQLDPPFAFE